MGSKDPTSKIEGNLKFFVGGLLSAQALTFSGGKESFH